MKTALFAWRKILTSTAVQRTAIRAAIKAMERGVLARRAYVSKTGARCLMALVIPTVRSRQERHAALRALDPARGEYLISWSNFLIRVFDGSASWPVVRRREFDRLLLEACRDELRRRSEVERAAGNSVAARQLCGEGEV